MGQTPPRLAASRAHLRGIVAAAQAGHSLAALRQLDAIHRGFGQASLRSSSIRSSPLTFVCCIPNVDGFRAVRATAPLLRG